jgi:hypothetical protein
MTSSNDYTKVSRKEWIALYESFNSYLFETCSSFSTQQWNRTSPYIGWRVRDVMVNITQAKVVNFWELLDRAMADNPVAPEEFDTFLRGQREVAPRKNIPIKTVLDNYIKEYERLLNFYRNIDDNDWMKPGWFFVGNMNIRGLFLVEFGDNVYHLRDMLLPNKLWNGLDAEYTGVLADWFMREYRPAHFRPENAVGVDAKILYRLSGTGGGAWTMTIKNQTCTVEKGSSPDYDVIVAADVEDIVAIALARTNPVVGKLARQLEWMTGNESKTAFVATIQHYAGFISTMLSGKIRIGGNKKLGLRINKNCFWHFFQRTQMTDDRIKKSRSTDYIRRELEQSGV